MRPRLPVILVAAGAILLVLAGVVLSRPAHAATASAAGPVASGPAAPADDKVLFGVQLAWDTDSPAGYIARSGVRPAQYGDFVSYAPGTSAIAALGARVSQAAAAHANYFLTLEPWDGLSTLNASNARTFAQMIARYNTSGVWFYIRFGQEMNGGWYPWGQRPSAYVTAFRTVADAVHR